jgi:phosphatidylinositol alpha-mannosyltransferase
LGRVTSIPNNGSIGRITLSLWLIPKLRSILEEEKFDIIHLHNPTCPLLPWIVIYLSNSINIGSFHAYYERSPGYWIAGRTILKPLVRRLQGRIAISEPAMECTNRFLPGHYRLIPHGVELKHFSDGVSPIEDLVDGKLNILFVGRLEKRKGVAYLIKAYEQVKRECPNSRLIIVGAAEKLGKIYEQQVRERELKDVIFAGYVSDTDLPRYYRTADIFCAPAIGKESFGMVLLEAMAAGKPIIASEIVGYSKVVTHGVEGLLVPPRDEEALAQAIISLLNDASLRHQMGTRGREKAEKHSWEHIVRQTMDYYLELLAERDGSEQD